MAESIGIAVSYHDLILIPQFSQLYDLFRPTHLSAGFSARAVELRPVRVGGLSFHRRIGVHNLDHGSTRLRVEGFIRHKQGCPLASVFH